MLDESRCFRKTKRQPPQRLPFSFHQMCSFTRLSTTERARAATLRRSPEADSEVVANNISTLLQRVAGSSVQEIDRLIAELQTLRELLQAEGVRVQREITEYAHLSQSAMQSTKVINESLAKWKSEGDRRARG